MNARRIRLVRGAGIAALAFFTLKGLAWIGLAAAAAAGFL